MPYCNFAHLGCRTTQHVELSAKHLADQWVVGPPAEHDGTLAVLRAVVDGGITHIDTSAAYVLRVTDELISERRRVAHVGFVGVARNEHIHEATQYLESLPDDLSTQPVFVLDPMLAAGGSMAHTIKLLHDRNAVDITPICLGDAGDRQFGPR